MMRTNTLNVLKKVFILFLVINALFWGLFPHSKHCQVASMLGFVKCPPHWIHVYVMGLGSFVLALYLEQGDAGFF